MAHYAFLDSNNIVTEVIVGRNENEIVAGVSDWETHYGNIRGQICKRTSYNNNIRKQFAGVGYLYDPNADVFITPKPYSSWLLNENHDWESPVPMPTTDGRWWWNEETLEWTR
jgi:hypothetical protein